MVSEFLIESAPLSFDPLSLKSKIKYVIQGTEADMYAIEFEADIGNNVIPMPVDCQNLNKAHVRVIVLAESLPHKTPFNPKDFFGVGHQSKQFCDAYLADVRDGWK